MQTNNLRPFFQHDTDCRLWHVSNTCQKVRNVLPYMFKSDLNLSVLYLIALMPSHLLFFDFFLQQFFHWNSTRAGKNICFLRLFWYLFIVYFSNSLVSIACMIFESKIFNNKALLISLKFWLMRGDISLSYSLITFNTKYVHV